MNEATDVAAGRDPPAERSERASTGRRLREWVRRLRHRVTAVEVQRFDASMDRIRADRQRRCGVPDSSATEGHRPWCVAATQHLRDAARHRSALRLEPAWSSLKSAEREIIRSLVRPEDLPVLCATARIVRTEALEKLSKWRRDSVLQLLPPRILRQVCGPCDSDERADPTPAPDDDRRCTTEAATERLCVNVVEARRILDDRADNVYHQLRTLRTAVATTTTSLVVVMSGLFALVAADAMPAAVTPPASPLDDWRLMLAIMLLGAIGAYISSATRLAMHDDEQRIPELRVNYTLMAMRPAVGAANAVLVIVVLQSALGSSVELSSIGVLGVAVAAGFTERLVTRTVNSAADSLTK